MLKKQVLLATAEMGYGHLRALYPFCELQGYRIVILGQTDSSKSLEKKLWRILLKTYEAISRFKNFPIIGWFLFGLMNKLLSIPPRNKELKHYDNSFSLWFLEQFISMGLCKGIRSEMKTNNNLLLTSFYAPVIALSNEDEVKVYCQICDADLSRAWVVRNPSLDKTNYFAPCQRAVERLVQYGVRVENIHLTGYPFPDELIGGKLQSNAEQNYQKRILSLANSQSMSSKSPLKIAYVVGGAGAFSDVGITIAISLRNQIIKGTIILYLVAGIKENIRAEYQKFKEDYFPNCNNIQIVWASQLFDYFHQFTELVSHIHILWTKPSELIFYSALGIPIIMTEPLGPQEVANREWALEKGFGIDQNISKYTNLWVMNKLYKGVFSKMAQSGWDNGIRTALYSIPEIIDKIGSLTETTSNKDS